LELGLFPTTKYQVNRQSKKQMSQFNICIIQPTGYVHSLAFLELAELIMYSLIDLGHKSVLNFNQIDFNATNIIIGCHLLEPTRATLLPRDTIIFNTEQLDGNPSPWRTNILQWGRRFQIWDYSTKNIHWFAQNGIIQAKQLRIGYQRQLKRLNQESNKDIDVLFYGCINERRSKILNELTVNGLRVKSLFGVYGAARDRWIERSHLVINIHYYETQIFEIIRVFYLITNSAPVLSELNTATSIDSIYQPAIATSDYSKIPETANFLIKNPSLLNDLKFKSQDEIQKYPQKLFTEDALTNR
jgi:hypothetical protein